MSGILRLESLTKGNTLRQGDLTLLKYRLFDADGDKLDISGKSATVRLMKNDFTFIAYEKEGLTVAPNDTISFSVNKILPSGLYHLEVIVNDKYIFPSRDDEGNFNIDKSSLGADVTIVEATGVEAVARKATGMMKQDEEFIDDMIENVISDTNVGNIEEYYNQFNEATIEFESLKTQALNSVTKSQNALNVANGIDAKATNALSLSKSADTLSKSVQEQFNQVVIDGDSSVEAAQARVDASGQTNPTLKERLDKEHNEVTAQLAQTAQQLNAKSRTSTRVVATKDSINKLGADYILDGTNDAEIIREALHDVVGIGDGGEDFGWTHVKNTPVVPDLDFPLFWHDGTKFHAYGSYDKSTKIGHSTSVDGVNWVRDVNPVLQRGSAGSYDDSLVAVFHPWQEPDGSWHALYRANGDKIAYATSPDGVNWTKHANNPVINDRIAFDPAGLIKSNGVYYLYANTTGGDRRLDIYTSTDLLAWNKVSKDEPEWRGARYCSCPFKYNGKYYLITSKYYEGGRGSLLELWEDTTPLFKYGSRKFKGVVVYGRRWVSVDTPSVLTTTIERDVFYNNEFWCYYAKTVGGYSEPDPAFLTKEINVQTAIDKAVLPNMNGEVLLSEGEVIIEGESTNQQAISLDFGVTLRGLNTVLKLANGYNQSKARGVVSVDQDCLVKDVILDGNKDKASAVRLLHISNRGKVENIGLTESKEVPVIYGEIKNAKIYRNSANFEVVENGVIRNSKIYGNQTPQALSLINNSQAINCESFNNQYEGIYMWGDSKAVSCKSFNNGRYGIYQRGNSKTENCESRGHTVAGLYLADNSSAKDPVVKNNLRGILNSATANNTVIGGEVIDNGTGIEGVGIVKVDGVYLKGNKGYLDRQQITLQSKSRITNCIFENGEHTNQYQIYITDGGDGSTIGGNRFEKGSVGYIGKTGFPTPVTYNNEELV